MWKHEEKMGLSLSWGGRWTGFGHKRETREQASAENVRVSEVVFTTVRPSDMRRLQGISFRRYLQAVSFRRHWPVHLRPLSVAQYGISFQVLLIFVLDSLRSPHSLT